MMGMFPMNAEKWLSPLCWMISPVEHSRTQTRAVRGMQIIDNVTVKHV
jgi:hypothetical protein